MKKKRISRQAHLVRIGNSRGVRLPKLVIEKAGLGEEVELRVQKGAIIIARASSSRFGWADGAREARQRQEDHLLAAPSSTRFDDKEWEW